ncbi:hypothetical protein LTS18_009364 [Coniosporium uncinatum]|uniref:Uncharacterized protein n=1 Tax=Coniosporium uncinatum TaxID=93489 RepID=A0ACC3D0M0_9PEZI|nr:hypothetical protein LTS18_009364 [Coniosporium uncinatum]
MLATDDKHNTSAFGELLSFTSYLFQHAHRSTRASLYTYNTLLIIRLIVEDQVLAKQLCSDEKKATVRLCRQRQPYLTLIRGERTYAAIILDILIDGINHNLRRRLDVEFYILLSFIRFLNTYDSDIKQLYNAQHLVEQIVNVIALALTTGEAFLPDNAAADDLFYKLVETGDILKTFRDSFNLSKNGSMDVLISVSDHYFSLLEGSEKGKTKSKSLSPREVNKVIKQGYETLSIQARDGLDSWERFREADHRAVLKGIARVAVEDSKSLVNDADID